MFVKASHDTPGDPSRKKMGCLTAVLAQSARSACVEGGDARVFFGVPVRGTDRVGIGFYSTVELNRIGSSEHLMQVVLTRIDRVEDRGL